MMRVETHHYTDAVAFEQSLDVYRPGDRAGGGGSARPVVALVVGSAWLGHRPEIYLGTSWWNSAGPRAVARLGYTCVCIRHRGRGRRSRHSRTMAGLLSGNLTWEEDSDGVEMVHDDLPRALALAVAPVKRRATTDVVGDLRTCDRDPPAGKRK